MLEFSSEPPLVKESSLYYHVDVANCSVNLSWLEHIQFYNTTQEMREIVTTQITEFLKHSMMNLAVQSLQYEGVVDLL